MTLRSWLDRQARTIEQRRELSVALGCSWVLLMVCAFLHYQGLCRVFGTFTVVLMLVMFGFMARDNWENRHTKEENDYDHRS